MATGIQVGDECIAKFTDFKLQKGDMKDVKFVIYKITDDATQIVEDEVGEVGQDYSDLQGKLIAKGEPRYAVVDCAYTTADGRDASKIVFIAWVPDTCKIKQKMVYSGSKDALKRALLGIMCDINATDESELDFDSCIKVKLC
jgi:cofilin